MTIKRGDLAKSRAKNHTLTKLLQRKLFLFFKYFKNAFGCDEESKLVIFYSNIVCKLSKVHIVFQGVYELS